MKNKRTDEKLKNFLPLNRKFFEHPFWEEKREYSKAEAWLDLLQKANFKETENSLQIGYKTVKWATGQIPISYRYLATRWKWSHGRIKTFLDYLVKEDMVSLENIDGQTILTLTNFQKYNKPEAGVSSSNPRGSAVVADVQKNGTRNRTPSGTPNGTPNGTLEPAPVLDLTINPERETEHQTERQTSTPISTLPEQDRNKYNTVLKQSNTIEREGVLTPTQYGSNREPSIPTLEDVHRVFLNNGGTEEMADKFYSNYEATGWYKNNSPIKNFTSLVPSFITTYRKFEGGQVANSATFSFNKEDKNSYI